jgi:hypothetical protein
MTSDAKKTRWNWLSFTVGFAGALVVLGGTWGGFVVVAAMAAGEEERYLACLANLGYTPDMPPGTVDLDLLSAAASICLD